MPSSVSAIKVKNNNTCPHGLPFGACPICNGMGAGVRKVRHAQPEKTNKEWSYMKCLIQGQIMKGSKASREESKLMFELQLGFAKKAALAVSNFLDKMQGIISNVQNNLPPQLQNVFLKLTNSTIKPLMNIISKLPQIIEKIEQFVDKMKTQILAVAEKLSAIFGEIKNFIERKVYENFKKLTKKLLKFFIWDSNEENYQNDEKLSVFKSKELRKIKNAILILQKKGGKDAKFPD